MRNKISLRCGFVQNLNLVGRFNRANRDAVDAARQQIFDLPSLVGHRSGRDDFDLNAQILSSFVRARAGVFPKIGDAVRDEGIARSVFTRSGR
jgi:hypothetical protein